MKKRRVYIINDGGHDYSAASEHGELVYCTDGEVPRNDIHLMWRKLEPILSDADADDFILLSGLTSLCCVATAIMSANHGKVNFLVFSNGKYLPRELQP